jgi:hypothetical protein
VLAISLLQSSGSPAAAAAAAHTPPPYLWPWSALSDAVSERAAKSVGHARAARGHSILLPVLPALALALVV